MEQGVVISDMKNAENANKYLIKYWPCAEFNNKFDYI
jgi:hypothetical protein